jgi:Cu/Ag efflux protein CusF
MTQQPKLVAIFIGTLLAAVSALSVLAASPMRGMEHTDMCGMPMGEGVLKSADVQNAKARIAHKPVKVLGWPEATKDFSILKPVDLSAFSPGEHVHFLLTQAKGETYSIAMMCSLDVDAELHDVCMTKMQDNAMKRSAAAGKPCAMKGMEGMEGMDMGRNGHR